MKYSSKKFIVSFLMGGVLVCVGQVLWKKGGPWKSAWGHSFHRLFHWADHFQEVDANNELLRQENQKLRIDFENLRFQEKKAWAQKQTQKNKALLLTQTGSGGASTPSAVTYEPSLDLIPNDLFSLGIYSFQHREDEKAAVSFTKVLKTSEDSRFQEGRYSMLVAVAWYRVQNYTLAASYLDQVLKMECSASCHAQAMVWKALIAKKTNQESKSQFWLHALLENYPHALETAWVNLQNRK